MADTGYYSTDEVLKLVYTSVDGKPLISRASLLCLLRKGIIPSVQLGMSRRYFIPAKWVNEMLSQKV